MLMKSAKNVKVRVEDGIQSNPDTLDTGSSNNKWNSKGDKGQVLHTCAGTIHLNRIKSNCLGNTLQSRVWDYSRWQLNMSQQCHTCEKSSIVSRSYWKNKNLQFLKKFHAEAAAAFGSVLSKTFQIRKSKRELAEWWEDRKFTWHLFSSWCKLKSGGLKKIKLFCPKRRRLRR